MPSAARNSRVPSVAKISTPRSSRSRAKPAIPSRFATDSRARTRGILPFASRRVVGASGLAPRTVRRRPTLRPSIPPDMAYSGRQLTHTTTRSERDARPLGVPVPVVQPPQLPGPVPPDLDRVAGPAGRPRRPLQRPDPGAPPPPALPRHVGVAVVDRPDHVQPADRSRRSSCSTSSWSSSTEVIGIGTLVWIRFRRFPPILAAHEQRLARERYYSKQKFADPEATIRRRGGSRRRSAAGAEQPSSSRRCRSRSGASASATGGRTGRPARSG